MPLGSLKNTYIRILLALGLLTIIIGGAINYYNIEARQKYADLSLKKLQIVNETTQLLNDIKDSEIGQRGFLLTDNPKYLIPYDFGMAHIPMDIKALHELLDENSEAKKILSTKLEKQIIIKMEELKSTVALQKAGKKDEALKILNENVGFFTMNLIREHINYITDIERKAWKESRNFAIAFREKTNYVVYGSFAFIALLLIFAYILISKKTDENVGLVEQLKTLNQELEGIVAERTRDLATVNSKLIHSLEEIKENNAKLQNLNEEKNKFLSIASHDLKNPLSAIVGLVGLVKESNFGLHPELEQYMEYIGEASSKMTTLINYLLDVSRIELGKNNIKLEKVDYHFEVENTIYSYIQTSKKKQLQIHFEAADMKHVFINSDRYRIAQILDNLISNAIKYADINTKVEIKLHHIDSIARLCINNKGQAIKEQEMPLLFQKFQKLSSKPTGGESSSGLGLSIAKQFVEELNGKIWCESIEGKEITFFVDFPL